MAPRNLAELAVDAAERHGERKAMVFEGEPLSNFLILERAQRFQNAFAELGLGRGRTAAMCMMNSPLVFSLFGGVFRTGATLVPVMFQLSAQELNFIFGDTGAHCVVTDAALADKVREAVKGLPHVQWIAILGGEDNPNATPREYRLETLLGADVSPTLPQIDPEDVALMLYTSGTTGRPKGVMLTHGNFLASGETVMEAAELHLRDKPIISINALPMAHIFGIGSMNFSYLIPVEFAKGYIVQLRWYDPVRFMQQLQEHRATDMAGVPTMLAHILNHPEVDNYDLTSLIKVDVGGAPVPEELARRWSEKFGCRVRQLYGMTENCGVATCVRISKPHRPRSAGLPYSSVELRIVDEHDNPVPAGVSGEILTNGPTVMKGYHNRPEATAEAMRGGWLHTGDIGYLDEDGWLYIVDRKKDMIIKGGENIYPAEVESVLYQHKGIAEAAVVGAPDEVYGEIVVAFVVPQPGVTLDEEEVIAHCKTAAAKFKAPSRVEFLDALPKSGVGKILRRELRDRVK